MAFLKGLPTEVRIDAGGVVTNGRLMESASVIIQRGRIEAVLPTLQLGDSSGMPVVDARPHLLAPGYLDIQLNGAFGDDFTQSPGTIWKAAERLPEYGVTSFLPTIITSPRAVSMEGMEVVAGGPPTGWTGAMPLGLHIEGPFLNPAKKGAHNPSHIRLPDLEFIQGFSRENGIWLVTLAPEQPGAIEVIRELVDRGVVVSAGHSMATFEEARRGFQAGIQYGTHLFNAMPTLNHREPGLIGAVLDEPSVVVGIIPDGIHVHPALVGLVWRAIGSKRLSVVTDAMAALGRPPGRYRLGDHEVIVERGKATLADGTLAGSVLSLDEAVRNLVAFSGCTLVEALTTVTLTPAQLFGLTTKGDIAPGYDADLVCLTQDGFVQWTAIQGKLVFAGK